MDTINFADSIKFELHKDGDFFKIRTTYNDISLDENYDPSCKNIEKCEVHKFLSHMNKVLYRDGSQIKSLCYETVDPNDLDEIYTE